MPLRHTTDRSLLNICLSTAAQGHILNKRAQCVGRVFCIRRQRESHAAHRLLQLSPLILFGPSSSCHGSVCLCPVELDEEQVVFWFSLRLRGVED